MNSDIIYSPKLLVIIALWCHLIYIKLIIGWQALLTLFKHYLKQLMKRGARHTLLATIIINNVTNPSVYQSNNYYFLKGLNVLGHLELY